jgi:hypothetical protein
MARRAERGARDLNTLGLDLLALVGASRTRRVSRANAWGGYAKGGADAVDRQS